MMSFPLCQRELHGPYNQEWTFVCVRTIERRLQTKDLPLERMLGSTNHGCAEIECSWRTLSGSGPAQAPGSVLKCWNGIPSSTRVTSKKCMPSWRRRSERDHSICRTELKDFRARRSTRRWAGSACRIAITGRMWRSAFRRLTTAAFRSGSPAWRRRGSAGQAIRFRTGSPASFRLMPR